MAQLSEDLEPTRQSLLARLKNWDDQTSWLDFFNKYWRLIFSVARRSGLSEEEAQDVVQETILVVCKSIKSYQYQPERCSFRSWLMMLTRHRIIGLVRKKKGEPPLADQDIDQALNILDTADTSDSVLESVWNEEWERHLLAAATEQVRKQVKAKQFQIYDLYVMQNWPADRISKTLNVSKTQVYLAKHRVGRLMRKAVQQLSLD